MKKNFIEPERIVVNKETAVINDWDHIYCNLLKKIIDEGELFENRTGIDTLSIEGTAFKLDAGKEFPILQTKKVLLDKCLSEMLWIFQAQSNNVDWLLERNNRIWNEWRVDDDGIYRIYEPIVDEKEYLYNDKKEVTVKDLNNHEIIGMKAKSLIEGKTIKEAKYYGKEYAGTIGTAYGWINNKYKRPQYVLNKLKTDPHDRRMLISLWQDEYLKTAVLPSCVWSSEWKVKEGKLHAFVHQRSADTPLGLPFNISQYATLQAMFAKVSGLEVGNLNWSIMDTHIYINQLEGVKKQLERYKLMEKIEQMIKTNAASDIINYYSKLKRLYEMTDEKNNKFKELEENLTILELMLTKEKPILELANIDDFFAFDNKVNTNKEYLKENITGNKDIKVLKYKSAPFIKIPIAQ